MQKNSLPHVGIGVKFGKRRGIVEHLFSKGAAMLKAHTGKEFLFLGEDKSKKEKHKEDKEGRAK